MKKNNTFRRAAALMAALSITVSLAVPAFADTYYIDYGDITITKNEDGSQTIEQGGEEWTDKAGEETVITTSNTVITTLESDLEGPAAEDSGFGPVAEDNYQPAQPESTEEPKGADQPESAEEPKSADQHESAEQAQPQQAAPAAAPAGSTPVNKKDDGFWGNTITVINNFADKVLNLTLKDVKIDVSDTGGDNFEFEDDQRGKAALSVQGKGNVEIELDGNNELKSGKGRAGLEKTSTGTLTLKDDNKEAGSLTATGGYNGAGIGGGSSGSGENITINDGKVTATGGSYAAGIGGGSVGAWGGDAGSGKNITINGGTVNATGTDGGAGIGGGENGNGEDITINGGKVNASGAYGGAGIGGGVNGIGSKVTVSGAAQVTATATGSGPDWSGVGTGATIGNGGSKTPDGPVDGKEIQADISHLTTGYIHHIIYNPDLDLDGKPDGILKEWWEFALPKPIPDGESLDLHVETLKGAPLLFNTRQQGSTLRVTTDNLSARLHGTRQALETLQEQGVEQIQFVTTLKTTTLSVEDLLAEGGSWFALEHDGLGSRRLSAAQAESLKCWRH
ncbi:MAG: hypothetical protein ACLSGP_03350 [Faecalibacterium prausnitzii]